ncbi:PREDICTED: uncharacterized protein LOC108548299 [Eufriesea mexicana]|uniref:uncharacterized protein LOC108548299 n=1 Tax=Eufriesea mexicana TaxID=516756 RepID=UPI00083C1F9F|nr:PREDICTED: uncharacterized protein LOC108548299 [Eufriesea mexicana]
MILTVFYMIATSIQSRRILFLKTHLRSLFQGNATSYPSIMFYNKTLGSYEESKSAVNDCENDEFMTSCLCVNKSDARLEELLWYYGDMRLCTIFPQQKVDISSWLTYHYGKTFFPLHTNNCIGTLLQSEYKLYILVEVDLESYNPLAVTHATKVEDYGLIITWTANRNINLIIESDLDLVTKLFIAAMKGNCYVNNGLLLKRIETVLVTGKPCFYNNDALNATPTKNKIEWETHREKLKSLSNTAKIASEECKSLEVKDLPGLIVYPENAVTGADIEVMQRVVSDETIGSESRSQVSTPVSVNILQHETQSLQDELSEVTDDTTEIQGVPHSVSKSLDAFDNLEDKTIFCDDRSLKAESSKTSSTNYMAEIAAKLSHEGVKPPNVIIYADSLIARNNVKSVLEESLGTDKYGSQSVVSARATCLGHMLKKFHSDYNFGSFVMLPTMANNDILRKLKLNIWWIKMFAYQSESILGP